MAGIVAANADNGEWSTGIDWSAKILPVRVLGKCGGYFSDIMLGVAWAAGLPVEGAPLNPTPAHVINLSLGGDGACTPFEQTVIAGVLATGNVKAIVAASGNDNADVADHAPANCAGVIAVASTTSKGKRAVYTNHGAGITISAPGGQYNPHVHTDGIVVLSNNGVTTPTTDGSRDEGGTSFAAPMVSGVVSLMLAIAPTMTAEDVRSVLVGNAKAFPSKSDCTKAICGAGIVDAQACVKAAASVRAMGLASTPVDVVEFYNAALDHYFISADARERNDLDAGLHTGWARTGLGFKAYSAPSGGAHPVCRFYISPAHGDSHFFSASIQECATIGARPIAAAGGVIYESPNAFYVGLPDMGTGACAAGTVPVYRLWNNRSDSNHRYTIDTRVKVEMIAKGYLAEGYGPDAVVMCAPLP